MLNQHEIREKLARADRAITLKPALGLGTGVSTARVVEGLACKTSEGPWTFTIDMPEGAGGSATGPAPGVLGRAALGSCLAIGYKMWASRLGVPVASIEVEVKADWDDAGMLGVSKVAPGYLKVQYTVRVESDAPRERILAVLDAGDRHSPYLDVFSRAQPCERQLEIVPRLPESHA